MDCFVLTQVFSLPAHYFPEGCHLNTCKIYRACTNTYGVAAPLTFLCKNHKIFACVPAICFGALIFRWKSLKLLQTPLECKHVPLQTLSSGKFRVVQQACRFNWPRSPLQQEIQYISRIPVHIPLIVCPKKVFHIIRHIRKCILF